MSAWQIPLSGTPAPRQNAFEATQEAQLNDTRNKLGQQQVLSEQARLRSLPQEDALRAEQIRAARLGNDETEAAIAANKAYWAEYLDDHKDHPSFGDGAAAPAKTAPTPLSAPPPTPTETVEPQRLDEFGRKVGYFGTVLSAGTPRSAAEEAAAPPRMDEFGRSVVSAPEPTPTTVPQSAPAAIPQAPAPTGSLTSGIAPQPAAPLTPTTSSRFDRAMKAAIAAGHGAGANALQKNHIELLTKQFTLQKDQAEAAQKAGEQVASLLYPIQNAPAEQQESMYQRVLPTLRQIAPQLHVDPSHIPDHADPQFIAQGIGYGTKVSDQARIVKEGADAARMGLEQNLKNAGDLEKRYHAELSDPKLTAADLAIKNERYGAYARQMDPSGTLSKAFDGFKVATWSKDLPERMNTLTMTGEQRANVPRQAAQDKLAERRVAATELNARTNASRLGNENATRHKEMVSQLADQATQESYQNGGKTLDDVLRNLDPAKGFYEGHPIGKYRGEVQAEIQRRRTAGPGGLAEQKTQLGIDKAKEDKALMDAIMGKTSSPAAPPSGGGRGAPAAPPTNTLAPKPAAPAATPAAPARKYTEAQIRQHAITKGFAANGPEADAAVAKARTNGSLQ